MDVYEEDFNDTWMINETEEWNLFQNCAQNLSELINKIEDNVNENFTQLTAKISGIGKFLIFLKG